MNRIAVQLAAIGLQPLVDARTPRPLTLAATLAPRATPQAAQAAARGRRMALAVHARRHQQRRPRERPRPPTCASSRSSTSSSPRRKPSGASPSTASYRSLADTALDHLTVPGKVLADDNRYISISGCVVHFCPARGLLWVDLNGKHAPPRRLRRHRLDQARPPHQRSRRRIHPLGLP